MNDFREKLESISFGVKRVKTIRNETTGEVAGEQVYHKNGTVSAIVTPTVYVRSNEHLS